MCLLPVPAIAVTVALWVSRVDLVFMLFKPFHAQRKSVSTSKDVFFLKALKAPYQKPPPSFLRSFLLPTPEIHLGKKKKNLHLAAK